VTAWAGLAVFIIIVDNYRKWFHNKRKPLTTIKKSFHHHLFE
jgi:hypothetical protein